MPVGSINPFWLPPTTQSIFHSSMRKSSDPKRGDRIDQEQRRMLRGVDRRADLIERQHHAGRGLVVHDADRLDRVLVSSASAAFTCGDVDAMPPVAGTSAHLQPVRARHVAHSSEK